MAAVEPERMANVQVRPDLPLDQLKSMFEGTLVKQLAFDDKDGHGLLLLSRSEETLKEDATEESVDRITLIAEQFIRTTPDVPWTSRWQVEQPTSCEGLDLEADYFLEQTQATDLDEDGRAELTFASHSFCGGGIDSQHLRIDVRQGDQQHFVVNGDSLVEIEGDPPFGGERRDDPNVAKASTPLRAHLDNVWTAIKHGSTY
ncbi:hypothetical protein ABB27_10385 [Stenotrophomonas terrae]|uniref:Uncharacterized protein n=1 Tax=Stenotrophomonas terrae TaxID=405446 RepID=A0A0R0CDX0_9GAMM|nr:hypothetical protein ABB27_10385 [Stenotrophomonas terrae]